MSAVEVPVPGADFRLLCWFSDRTLWLLAAWHMAQRMEAGQLSYVHTSHFHFPPVSQPIEEAGPVPTGVVTTSGVSTTLWCDCILTRILVWKTNGFYLSRFWFFPLSQDTLETFWAMRVMGAGPGEGAANLGRCEMDAICACTSANKNEKHLFKIQKRHLFFQVFFTQKFIS